MEHMGVDDITQGRCLRMFLKLWGQTNYSRELLKFRILSPNSRVSHWVGVGCSSQISICDK